MNQRGFGLIGAMVASVLLVISLMAFSSAVIYVQTANSVQERNGNAEDFIRTRLAAAKANVLIQGASTTTGWGGVTNFIRYNVEAAQNKFNPVLTRDLSVAAQFLSAFGFNTTGTATFHNRVYQYTFSAVEYKFDATFNPVPVTLNTDTLRDLAYIQILVDLVPVVPVPGVDGPKARHGEIYIAK